LQTEYRTITLIDSRISLHDTIPASFIIVGKFTIKIDARNIVSFCRLYELACVVRKALQIRISFKIAIVHQADRYVLLLGELFDIARQGNYLFFLEKK
jgi:hypothetical protein